MTRLADPPEVAAIRREHRWSIQAQADAEVPAEPWQCQIDDMLRAYDQRTRELAAALAQVAEWTRRAEEAEREIVAEHWGRCWTRASDGSGRAIPTPILVKCPWCLAVAEREGWAQ